MVKRSFINHSDTIYDIRVLPKSSYEVTFFVTGSIDKTMRIWHLTDSEAKEDLKMIRQNAYCKNLSRIIYLEEGMKTLGANSKAYQIRCLRLSWDSSLIASGD